VREETGRTLIQTLAAHLHSRTLLLLLDNCEHLLDAVRRLVEALLQTCLHLHVLVTSREPLHIAGEQSYRVPSLSLPDPARLPPVEELHCFEAVQLFRERAHAVYAPFAITHVNALAVVQVCVRLDGIPLALELAAVRVRSLSVVEINTRLDECFRLLTGGSRNTLPRQQTLRALIDWSYDLLNDQEKALLRRLSVFAGGWTPAAAETVGAGNDIEEWEALDLLTSLVDKSLVVAESGEEHTRYHLLETVRQYTRDRLAERGESESARQRHQAFFMALAEEAEPQLLGPQGVLWLHRLESEHDNLRAAMEWDNQETSLRIAGALAPFWNMRGYYTEGRRWLADTLVRADSQAYLPAQAKALNAAGALARVQGDSVARSLFEQSLALYRKLGDKQNIATSLGNLGVVAQDQVDYVNARALYTQSLTLYRELGNRPGIAHSLANLGNIAIEQCDYATAQVLHEQCLALYSELGNKQGIANSLMNLGNSTAEQGHYDKAQVLYEQGLTLYRELENKQGIANSLMNLGSLAYEQGDYAREQTLHEQSLALCWELGNKQGIAFSLRNLGKVAAEQIDYSASRPLLEQGLVLYRELGNKRGIAYTLEAFATLACVQDQVSRAVRCWGAAEILREEISTPLSPLERARHDAQIKQAHTNLGKDAFTMAWSEGRAMTMEQAIEYMLEGVIV
jgi:predicted ATPase